MITVARRRRPSPALLAMLVVLGLPALSEAQLIPNLFVRRQKPSCATEDPIYRVYRQQYYGYYPTQWRTFPAGWNLISPESVTPSQLEEARRSIQKEINAMPALDEDGQAAPEDDTEMPEVPDTKPEAPLPLPPRGGSVFDLNPQPPTEPGPLPDDNGVPGTPRASTRRPSDEASTASTDPLDSAPPLDDAESTPSVESDSPPAIPPIEGSVSPGTTYAPREDDMPVPPLGAARGAGVSANTAPQRKTLIGGLFDTMRGRRRR